MNRFGSRLAWLLVAGIAAAAALLWWTTTAAGRTEPAGPVTAPGPAAEAAPLRTDAPPLATGGRGEPIAPVGPSPAGPRLRIELVGLDPRAPWSAPLAVRAKGRTGAGPQRFEARVAFDPGGAAELDLPTWTGDASRLELRCEARDPLYAPVAERLEGAAARAAVLRLAVKPVCVLGGVVVDAAGDPVAAARVVAFPVVAGRPRNPAVGRCNTTADGAFRLQALVAGELLVVALPMHELQISGQRLTAADGAVADADRLRTDLLPAAAVADAVLGHDRARLPLRLSLAAPAPFTGRVVGPQGGIAGAHVAVAGHLPAAIELHSEGTALAWDEAAGVTVPEYHAETDAAGAFVLPGQRGVAATVRLVRCGDDPVIAPPAVTATAPARIELRVDAATVEIGLRRPDGASVDGEIELRDAAGRIVAAARCLGRRRLLVPTDRPLTVVASAAGFVPRRQPLPVPATGQVVELTLLPLPTATVVVELVDDVPVRHASFIWTPIAGTDAPPFQRVAFDDFTFAVPPGRWRLRIEPPPGNAERRDACLVPVEKQLDVPEGGLRARIPTTHGGRIRFEIVDARGLPRAGRVTLVAADGQRFAPRLEVRDGAQQVAAAAGTLSDRGVSVTRDCLPPGRYRVELDLGAHGPWSGAVDVRPMEDAAVCVRR